MVSPGSTVSSGSTARTGGGKTVLLNLRLVSTKIANIPIARMAIAITIAGWMVLKRRP
jgi:hypothetical protein